MRTSLLPAAVVILSIVSRVPASALTAHLITDPGMVDHGPGDDFRIGTADDRIDTGPIGVRASAPNLYGALSFALLDDLEGGGLDEILFVDGILEFTPQFAASGLTDLALGITGGTLRATAECNYPALGDQGSTVTSGVAHLNPLVGSATVQLNGTFGRPGDTLPLMNETLASAPGAAVTVLASNFGHSGNAYVDQVLVPLVPPDAAAIIVAEFTGTTVTPGCCTGFRVHGVFAAYTTDGLGCADIFPALCGSCTTTAGCCAALKAALPDPAIAPSKKSKNTATRLARLDAKKEALLARAATASARRQPRFYKRVRRKLASLLAQAGKADGKGTLGVPLAPIQAAVEKLQSLLPT